MRPKRVILLVDCDEDALSLRRFLLGNYPYRVISATSRGQAAQLFAETFVDLVIVEHRPPGISGPGLIETLKDLKPDIPMILTSDSQCADRLRHLAEAFLGRDTTAAELLERIRIVAARKRGPKPVHPEMVLGLAV